jgi:hypothetical protein
VLPALGGAFALAFDGSDDRASGPRIVGSGGGTLTIERWVRPRAAAATGILLTTTDDSAGWSLELENGAPVWWLYTTSGWQAVRHPTALAAERWSHLAVTFSGGTAQIFLDGAPGTAATLDAATEGPYVGGTPNYPFFAGDLDEIRLSRVARYTGSFTPPSGPFSSDGDTLALYHLDEGSGQVAADATPNQYDLTLGASPNVESSDPSWVSGTVVSTARAQSVGLQAQTLTARTTRSISYRYDGLNRLTGADESGSTANSYAYGYGLAGNPRRRRV